jgi:hypothetical protein
MKKIVSYIFAGILTMLVASPIAATAFPTPVSAAGSCETTILGIPPWYRGLTNADCSIKRPTDASIGGIENFIWRIVLNVIQMGLVIAAYIAVAFIIWGGFLFMTGGSNPSQVEKGRKSVFNAVIGLVIALGAVAVTNFIFGIVGETSTIGRVEGIARNTDADLVGSILSIVFFLLGTIAVVVIIIAGLSFTTAGGDPSRITKSKNMLTYAIVGLVIAILAFAITNFVVENFA